MNIIILLISLYLVIYDIKFKKVPNYINLLLLSLIILNKLNLNEDLVKPILGGLLAFNTFYLIYLVTKGGIGIGDCKYTALIAVHFGYYFWIKSIFISSIIALFVTTTLYIRKKIDKKTKIPFIPFLVLGWIFLLFKN